MQSPNTRVGRVLLATLLFAAPAALAADFEITPLVGYRAGGSFIDTVTLETRNIDEDASFGIALDLRRSADTQWEITYSRQDTQIEQLTGSAAGPLDLRIDYLQLGGTYFYSEEAYPGYEPYVVGGLGITRFTPTRAGLDNRIEPSLNFGVGLRVPVAKRVALRFEGRVYTTFLGTSSAVFCKSDNGDAACRIRAQGQAFWQVEALAGVAFRF
jgi:Outer membrane protein beta-barrel domain